MPRPGAAAPGVDALFASLYAELHRLARRQLQGIAPGESLGTTTLLHEAYLKLHDLDAARFPDRSRFLAYASRAMRSLVIDYARRRRAVKRGGEYRLMGDDLADRVPSAEGAGDVEPLEEAMGEIDRIDPAVARLVDLHVFCGFSLPEIAALRGVSERTLQREWQKARLLLRHLLATTD